jgi:hypothetical protein
MTYFDSSDSPATVAKMYHPSNVQWSFGAWPVRRRIRAVS